MTQHKLVATNANAARREAQQFAPCSLIGKNKADETVYISYVRKTGDDHPVATATRNRSDRAVSFIAEVS